MNKLLADNFTNIYNISKTLKFRLIPQGKTQQYIERDGILDADFQRAENYAIVKKIIDRYHKQFINKTLSNITLSHLNDYMRLYLLEERSDQENKELTNLRKDLLKQVSYSFTSQPEFKILSSSKTLIENELPKFADDAEQKVVNQFKGFTTYFRRFLQQRKNLYSSEEKSTSIAYRIVYQNLPKYMDNIRLFQQVKKALPSKNLKMLEKNLQEILSITSLDDYFLPDGFNKVLTQRGIDYYNAIIGGYVLQPATKVKGLNEYINLYNQVHEKALRLPMLKPLFKQILTERESLSFVYTPIQSDAELLALVDNWYQQLVQTILYNEKLMNVQDLIEELCSYDLSGIYISNDQQLRSISEICFSDWATIKKALEYHYDNTYQGSKNTSTYEKNRKKVLKQPTNYSIQYLNQILGEYLQQNIHIEEYMQETVRAALENIKVTHDIYNQCLLQLSENKDISKNKTFMDCLKSFLDSIKKLQWSLKPFEKGLSESVKNELFYSEFSRIWQELQSFNSIYNRVRNYVTKRPRDIEQVKLNFSRPSFLSGWDRNTESSNLGIILRKNGKYYLGVINANHHVFTNAPTSTTADFYEKMDYKYIPSPYKMLPKIMIAGKKAPELYGLTEEIKEKYKQGTHIKSNANFKLKDCHALIDYFKAGIAKYEDWKDFHFEFSDTKTYRDISDFYQEMTQQAYKVSFHKMDTAFINSLVDNGELYLFQIYNKDFSEYSKGTPNLYTLYWNALFNSENLVNPIYKLSGNAEIFYRKASISKENMIVHPKNQPVKNKSAENMKKESTFEYDLIKDKHYTVDQYQLNVRIVMNFQERDGCYLNNEVNSLVHDAEDMHIMGVYRGKDNLLYVSMIDLDGNIIKQFSLNQIVNLTNHKQDFYHLLESKKQKNKDAQQNWKEIQSVNDLKTGYLSQVIHEITHLMLEYNAVVVMEDITFSNRGNTKELEKNIYQTFEKKLIDKLNYLVDKQKDIHEPGGLMCAYQLTNKFNGFQKIGKQSGFLYYAPEWYTDNLDPTTGFVNKLYLKYESIQKSKMLIENLDGIFYNANADYFEFSIDFSKFANQFDECRNHWVICSFGKRIEHYPNPNNNKQTVVHEIELTKEWKSLFDQYSISLEGDLKNAILTIEEKTFFTQFYRLLRLTLQMTNRDARGAVSYFISPVMNRQGNFFQTSKEHGIPEHVDAVGAYNLACKGLWMIQQIKNTDLEKLHELKLTNSNKEWVKYVQQKTMMYPDSLIPTGKSVGLHDNP